MKLEKVIERLEDLIETSKKGVVLHPYDKDLFLTDKEALEIAVKELKKVSKLKEIGLHTGVYRFCEDCKKLNSYKKALMYFETEEELSKMTGLNHNELWNANFDLDDWDYGIAIDVRIEMTWRLDHLIERLDCQFCRREVIYNGIKYIMFYHS